MLIGAIVPFIAYKLHYYVERRFKIDDAVGAVAVHGYGGFLGVVVAGFMLWGQPSSPYEGFAHSFRSATSSARADGRAWLYSDLHRVQDLSFGLLRVPAKVELEGVIRANQASRPPSASGRRREAMVK